MAHETCPLPGAAGSEESQTVTRLLAATRIAVIGASEGPTRAGHYVPAYLMQVGKQILPVNPKYQQVLGVTCYPSLSAVPGPVDLVNVFRRPEACPEIVREAVATGAKGVWLQSGIVSDEARQMALEAGLDFVQDRCLMVEHRRHG